MIINYRFADPIGLLILRLTLHLTIIKFRRSKSMKEMSEWS